MGASPAQVGTARAQLHLRQVLGHMQARVLPPPELLVARAHERFDKELRLTDDTTRRILAASDEVPADAVVEMSNRKSSE